MDADREAKETWEAIGASFAHARPEAWPPVAAWIREHFRDSAAVVLDLAGGAGRHGAVAAEAGARVVVADVSRGLLRLCSPWLAAVEASASTLPFRDDVFDGALFVAGLHAMRGRGNRVQALAELARVLKPGSLALVTVWHRARPRFARLLAERASLHGEARHEIVVPWLAGDLVVPRSTFLYDEAELAEDLRAAGLEVDRVESVAIGREGVDNVFAQVRAPRAADR